MQGLSGQRVLVLGLGTSGRSAAAFCAERGARVLCADERTEDQIEGLHALPREVECVLGRPFPDSAEFDLVVPSPGVPAPRYRGRAQRVWGDVELLGRALPIPIVAVTGTNGKSTTTLLVTAMLRAAGLRAEAAGNVGTPALSLVGRPLDVAVLEVSSFQLETTEAFHPRVAVLLNLTPDHLDRHGSFEAYAAAKSRIFANQGPEDAAVVNFGDPHTRALASDVAARVWPFSTAGALEYGVWLDAGFLALRTAHDAPIERLPLDGLRLAGAHNLENVVASLAAAAAVGARPSRAVQALSTFEGLPHRTQIVARRGGITYVDDSKATNPGAALRSLASFEGPLVWIAGGRGKGLDLTELALAASQRVRAAVLLGEAAPVLERVLAGKVAVERADSIEDATRRAVQIARAGDVVLLSPGCSSHDQFDSFEERGQRFQAAIETFSTRAAGGGGSA